MIELFKKTALAGLGAAVLTQEKIEAAIQDLVKSGEMREDVGQKLVHELIEKGEDGKKEAEATIISAFQMMLDKINLATKTDIAELQTQVTDLCDRLDQLEQEKA
jgi:polyhydroxyalkanoate synthesis regulator phasin